MGKKKRETPQCELDMTPMIDVVFQLIIFFVVTLQMTDQKNEDIILEDGKHGELITNKNSPPSQFVIEVAKNGNISVMNAQMSVTQLQQIIRARQRRFGGTFPCLIRADYRTRHDRVKVVMDACTACGLWQLSFVAINDRKSSKPIQK